MSDINQVMNNIKMDNTFSGYKIAIWKKTVVFSPFYRIQYINLIYKQKNLFFSQTRLNEEENID